MKTTHKYIQPKFLLLVNRLSLILITSFILTSCEEVIELNLQNSDPKIVIESVITEGNEPVEVKITKSVNFYEEGIYSTLNDALIIFSDNNGLTDTLKNTSEGIYSGKTFTKNILSSYTVKVIEEGITYTASNTIPIKTELDSLTYEVAENPRDKGYMVNMYFFDAPNVKNYYRVKIFVDNKAGQNQSFGASYILYEDKIFDGKSAKLPILRGGGQIFHANDTVTVELYSLSKATYDYYLTLKNVVTSDNSVSGRSFMEGSSAPANPTTNFDNGALGYFGAYCLSKKQIAIKP